MVHRTELNTRIAQLSGISKHTIDRIGVNLNKGGLIFSGGRGRHAPHMGPADLKNILLALLGSDSSGRVFETVLKLQALTANDGKKFGAVLLEVCSDNRMAAEVMQISVLRNYPQAAIYWRDESGTRIGRMQDFRSLSEEHQPGMKVVASLNGNVVSKLVELVSGQEHLPETSDEQIKKAG